MTTLVLASASPARRATLRAAGVEPLVVVSAVDEEALTAAAGALAPADLVHLLAAAKAQDVAARPGLPPDAVVLGCDSLLALDGVAHGKPRDAGEATERWRRMRGRSGVLHTGHWVVDTRGHAPDRPAAALGEVASTVVHFADVDDEEIAAYVATGEPLAVAGAFTLDGLGGPFVAGVEGDPHAVVGVSLPLLRRLLGRLGLRWTDLWAARR